MQNSTRTNESHSFVTEGSPSTLGSPSDIPFMGYLGGSFAVGMSIGYFSKKAMKLALFLSGMVIVGFLVLAYNNQVQVPDSSIFTNSADHVVTKVGGFGGFVYDWLSTVNGKDVGGVGLGGIGGFFVGWKMA